MFVHNFKYSFKVLFGNKSLIFWTFCFPIILGTLFNMAFKDIESNEKLDIINVGIVLDEENDKSIIYKEYFDALGDMFDVKYTSLNEAEDLLKEKEIVGYFNLFDERVIVNSSGIDETVFLEVVKEINEQISMFNIVTSNRINEMIKLGEEVNYEEVISLIKEKMSNISSEYVRDISSSKLSYTMIEYYTLIAMAALYSGILVMVSINRCLPNMSNNGKRVSVSKISKFKLVMSSVLSSYLVQLIGLVLLFLYTIFVLNVDFGDNLPLIIILALVGTLAGLSLGVFVASVIKGNENLKTGIILSISMLGCFLSGMMGITMKYIVDTNVPILNKINPANMITDGFYSLYYYDGYSRYLFNVFSLIVFSLILFIVSIIYLRRQKYDNI